MTPCAAVETRWSCTATPGTTTVSPATTRMTVPANFVCADSRTDAQTHKSARATKCACPTVRPCGLKIEFPKIFRIERLEVALELFAVDAGDLSRRFRPGPRGLRQERLGGEDGSVEPKRQRDPVRGTGVDDEAVPGPAVQVQLGVVG